MDRKARIQGELRMRGNSQKTVADAAGVSEATVSKVVADQYSRATVSSRRTRDAVLKALSAQTGLAIAEIEALPGTVADDARSHAPAA